LRRIHPPAYAGGILRRRVNIGPYIVDFLCREHKIVIELDGGIHNRTEQKEHDTHRDNYLREFGYQIMRIQNESVHKNLKLVLQNIHSFIQNNTQQTAPSPPERRGLG
jgi:very-short-patch-repair endonuclease